MDDSFKTTRDGYVKKFNEYCYKVNYESYYKHKHTFWEFFCITEGTIKHILNKQSQILTSGDIVLITPGNEHYFKFIQDAPYEHYDLYATPTIFASVCNLISPECFKKFQQTNSLIKVHVPDEKLKDFNFRFSRLANAQSGTNTELKNSIYYPLLMQFISLTYNNCLMFLSEEDQIIDDFIAKANAIPYVCGSLENLLSICNYSHGHFCKVFKNKTGKTLKQFHNELKMNYATYLLRNQNLTILDISETLGYSSYSHFIKIFKEFTNLSPYQYRKQIIHPT